MTLSLYLPGRTPLHGLHPVTKVLGFLGLIVAAFVVDRPALLLALALPAAGLLVLAGGAGHLRRFAPVMAAIAIVTVVIWTLFYGARRASRGCATGSRWRPVSSPSS